MKTKNIIILVAIAAVVFYFYNKNKQKQTNENEVNNNASSTSSSNPTVSAVDNPTPVTPTISLGQTTPFVVKPKLAIQPAIQPAQRPPVMSVNRSVRR